MLKRVLATALTVVMLLSCMVFSGVQAANQGSGDSRVYVPVERGSFEEHIDAKTAPVKEGYLFAGWVARTENGKGIAIKSKTDAVLSEANVTVTAKYIPAHVAGVACQVKANTYDEGVTKTDLRIVSAVDNGTYQGFGFNLYKRIAGEEILVCAYSASSKNPVETQDRYSGLYVYSGTEKTVKTPEDVFGSDARGFYFTTVKIANIPQEVYDSCIFVIKPYWITADGTYVEGLGEYNRVSDGKNNIVNISVNIQDAQAIAAGMVNVSYDSENYSFVSADCGRVFEEMQTVHQPGTVKCIGNVADITGNSQNPDDIFINLRFQKKGTVPAGTSVFTVEPVEFCDKDEVMKTVSIEDVIY